jgi:hypothetical protein
MDEDTRRTMRLLVPFDTLHQCSLRYISKIEIVYLGDIYRGELPGGSLGEKR